MVFECLRGNEILKTKSLYDHIFADPEQYTRFFFEKAVREGTALVYTCGEQVVSEVFLFPKTLIYGDRKINAMYIYGVATLEEYRGQGLMRKLMIAAENMQTDLLYLIPVDENIYTGLGYRTVKKEKERIYRRDMEENFEQEYVLERLHSDKIDREQCENIILFMEKMRKKDEVFFEISQEYIRDCIARADADDGEIWLIKKKDTDAICAWITIGEHQGEKVLLGFIGDTEQKQHNLNFFMKQRNMVQIKEYTFSVMVKIQTQEIRIEDTAIFRMNEVI